MIVAVLMGGPLDGAEKALPEAWPIYEVPVYRSGLAWSQGQPEDVLPTTKTLVYRRREAAGSRIHYDYRGTW